MIWKYANCQGTPVEQFFNQNEKMFKVFNNYGWFRELVAVSVVHYWANDAMWLKFIDEKFGPDD